MVGASASAQRRALDLTELRWPFATMISMALRAHIGVIDHPP